MISLETLKDTIFASTDAHTFEQTALAIFNIQAAENSIYKQYIDALGIHPALVKNIQQIPFLPISFFKSHRVKTGHFTEEITFFSSGTTGMQTSKHFVKQLNVYQKSYLGAFQQFYGEPKKYAVLALLPNYVERGGSSLVYMAHDLIKKSGHAKSGFYLDNDDELQNTLHILAREKTPTLLLGVSFALLDLAEKLPSNFHHPALTVMETGGMKGKRKEMIREELHAILKSAFHVPSIHSEYGMTELLSQAYSTGNGIFKTPPWMKVLTRDTADPLSVSTNKSAGGLNIIDLANLYSCSFIATQDLGTVFPDGSFLVLGRFDNAEIRGCNLMVQ